MEKLDFSSVDAATISDTSEIPTQTPPRFKLPGFKSPRNLGIVGIVLIILAVLSVFTIVLPAAKTYSSVMKTQNQAKKAWEAAKKQNIALAKKELAKTKTELLQTQKELHSFSFAHFVPIVNWYYNDMDHILNAGLYGLDATNILVESVEPYADVLGLKGQGSFVMGSAQERIKVAVLTMGKITPRIDDISKSLALARSEIDQVNPNHYPPIFAGRKIKTQLTRVKTIADEGVKLVEEARPLIKVLPSLLGESEDKRYIVIFQNDKELRPTGGFLTAYAVFRLEKGIIHVDTSDDIYTLDNRIRSKQKAPEPILKYLPKVSEFHIRDSNLSPDFVESMKTFYSMYETTSKADIDGIITLDTHVLVSTIKILDDEVWAGGVRFTSKTDERCNCPQVIYELERLISTPKSIDIRYTDLSLVQAARKDIIGVLLYAIMEKALKSSPKKYWGPLVQDVISKTNEKHVLFYLFDKNAQAGVEALNAAGKIKDVEGDYLHINEANMGGAKANMFVEESVTQDIEVSSDGVITKIVTVSYKNPHPPSDCNLERGNLCLNATLRDFVRVYVPKGSILLDSKGSEVKVTTYEELGKTAFEGFLTVRPKGVATYTLKYKLPFKLSKNSPLPLLIQKQPGTDKNQYTIKVNGKQVQRFDLAADKEVKLTL